MGETADLKCLAELILRRDTSRDSERDTLSRARAVGETGPRHPSEVVSLSRPVVDRDTETGAYATALAALERRCPDYVDADVWRQAITDGRRFVGLWGIQAVALGWTPRDLFGLHRPPDRPAANYQRLGRYDETGLVWLLQGRRVVTLTDTTAAIQTPMGAILTYRRHYKPTIGPEIFHDIGLGKG